MAMDTAESSASSDPTLRAEVDVTKRRARLAMAGVAFAGAMNVLRPVAPALMARAGFVNRLLLAQVVPAVVAAVLFCRWLYRAYEDNRRLGGLPVRFTPGGAVASFFLPFINFYRPYQVMRDLHAASDPRMLPNPPLYRVAEEGAHYRSSARELIAPPDWNKWFPVAAWWAFYMYVPWVLAAVRWNAGFADPSGVMFAPVSAVSTVLAIHVIRSIQARQCERLRRLEIVQDEGGGVSA
jgi:hypothetical protein